MTRRLASFHCDRCGAEMIEHHCKIVCPRCGLTRDCSDPRSPRSESPAGGTLASGRILA